MTAPDPGAWPLSAAATAVLREPRTGADPVLRLSLRELAVRGVLRLGEVHQPRSGGPTVVLYPGTRSAAGLPAPLPQLAEALLPHVPSDGVDAGTAVAALGWRRDLPGRLRRHAREALCERGLLEQRRERVLGVVPVTRWRRTPSGQAWASSVDAFVRAPLVLPAVGVLLLLDREVARALRAADGAEAGVHTEVDNEALDALDGAAGDALDGAADGGSGGDGGDGGGGGD